MFAIDDLSDAIDVTRAFLTPVRLGTWLKLALLVFFVGGVGFSNPAFSGGGFGDEGPTGTQVDPGTVDVGELLPILVVVGLLVLVVGLAYLFLGSVLEFTLLESLRSGEVHIRRYTKRSVDHGLRLFGFRVVLGLVALASIGLPLLAVFVSTSGTASLALFGLVVLVAIPVFLAYAVVSRLTTVFVAPTMLQDDLGVVAAWKRFWPALTGNWAEYLVYLLLVWLLQLVITFATGILLLVLLIPFVIVFAVLLFIPFLNLLVLLLGIPLFVLLTLLVQVPVVVYLRYYALLLLGDTDAELDLIPDQRAAVRDGGPGSGGTSAEHDARDDRAGWDERDESDSFDSGWDDSDDDASDRDGWDDSSGSNGEDDDGDEQRGW